MIWLHRMWVRFVFTVIRYEERVKMEMEKTFLEEYTKYFCESRRDGKDA